MNRYPTDMIDRLNRNIEAHFPHLFLIDHSMKQTFSGVSRLVMLDRYAQKDINHLTLSVGDLVLCIIRNDPRFPSRGVGNVVEIDEDWVRIRLEDEYVSLAEDIGQNHDVVRQKNTVDKPLELFYEQIAMRVAANLGSGERIEYFQKFFIADFRHFGIRLISNLREIVVFIPVGVVQLFFLPEVINHRIVCYGV